MRTWKFRIVAFVLLVVVGLSTWLYLSMNPHVLLPLTFTPPAPGPILPAPRGDPFQGLAVGEWYRMEFKYEKGHTKIFILQETSVFGQNLYLAVTPEEPERVEWASVHVWRLRVMGTIGKYTYGYLINTY